MSVLEEKMQEVIKAPIRAILRGLGKLFSYLKEKTAFHGKRSMKHLIKKYPNQGIHTEKELSKDDVDKIIKDLKKFKIDYSLNKIENDKDNPKFELTVVGGNKSVVQMLLNKYDINKDKGEKKHDKPVKKNLLDNVKNKVHKAKSINKERQAPVKHRDIGAR